MLIADGHVVAAMTRSPGKIERVHHAALAWRAQMEARLEALGTAPTQFFLLSSAGWLERGAGRPTQQQVADLAGAERTMTSKVLASLKQRGLITHAVDPNDARAYRLTLTPDVIGRGASHYDSIWHGYPTTHSDLVRPRRDTFAATPNSVPFCGKRASGAGSLREVAHSVGPEIAHFLLVRLEVGHG